MFQDIIIKVKEYLAARDHEVSAMVKFSNCKMKPDQTYAQWALDLEAISRKCNFKCENCQGSYASRIIRDVMILNSPHLRVQASLIELRNPQLQEVINIGDRHLVTKQAMAHIRDETTQSTKMEVNGIKHLKPSYKNKKTNIANNHKLKSCTDCYVGHGRKNCPHGMSKCKYCHRTGHIEKVCFRKQTRNRVKTSITWHKQAQSP